MKTCSPSAIKFIAFSWFSLNGIIDWASDSVWRDFPGSSMGWFFQNMGGDCTLMATKNGHWMKNGIYRFFRGHKLFSLSSVTIALLFDGNETLANKINLPWQLPLDTERYQRKIQRMLRLPSKEQLDSGKQLPRP